MPSHPSKRCFQAEPAQAAVPLVSALRGWLPGESWSQLRKLVKGRRITINGSLCLDDTRRLAEGDEVEVSERPLPPPPTDQDVRIHYLDHDLIVVEKPAGMTTLRHREQQHWTQSRKNLQPTLDEVVPRLIAQQTGRRYSHRPPPVRSVHRIDRDTSGLLVFARHGVVQRLLIKQFAQHDVQRVYLAVVPGHVAQQTITSTLARDRGDGLRGTTSDPDAGQQAITHVRPLEKLNQFTLIECRLETGRTHQIRIHLAERGHPVCGDRMYRGPVGGPQMADSSGAPRLALHAGQLGFTQPKTGEALHFEVPLPSDLERFVARLRAG